MMTNQTYPAPLAPIHSPVAATGGGEGPRRPGPTPVTPNPTEPMWPNP